MKRHRWILLATAALLAAAPAAIQAQKSTPAGSNRGAPDPLAEGQIFNIVDWDGGPLPHRYERSDQLPMTLDDVRKLSRSKFSDQSIVKMIEERRCACDASIDSLVALKEAGVSEGVIQAVSLHALPPNRSLQLAISIDFEGLGKQADPSVQARKGYLYLIIPDGDRERVFIGNLQAILARRWQQSSLVDKTDLLLPKPVRRIVFAAEVPLKVHGRKQAMVFTSTKPDIYTSADIPPADREHIQTYTFDYPASSLEQICDLQVLYRQDAMLPDAWHLVRSNFQCEWD